MISAYFSDFFTYYISFSRLQLQWMPEIFYENLTDTVLYCTPGYTSFPKDGISSEDNENLNAFFNQYKRRFF